MSDSSTSSLATNIERLEQIQETVNRHYTEGVLLTRSQVTAYLAELRELTGVLPPALQSRLEVLQQDLRSIFVKPKS